MARTTMASSSRALEKATREMLKATLHEVETNSKLEKALARLDAQFRKEEELFKNLPGVEKLFPRGRKE